MKKYRIIDKLVVLKIMCDIETDIMNLGYPTSIPNIAELLGTSKYQVRKYMKELEKEGLVKSECIYYDGRPDYETGELFDDPRIIRGWSLTEEAAKTDIYKDSSENVRKIIKEVFGE